MEEKDTPEETNLRDKEIQPKENVNKSSKQKNQL